MTATPTVMYRVHCSTFFRPCSSRCSFSTLGSTAPRIWNTMLAEMYGMMPNANSVARDRPPPTNRSYRPRSPPACWLLKKSISACVSMPGAVMCEPTRKMINASSVKPIRDFSSGVLKMLLTSWAAAFSCAMSVLDAASGRDNTLTHRRAHPDPADRHGARQRAVGQQLGRSLPLPDQSRLDEDVGRDVVLRLQIIDVTQVHDLRLHPEWIGEAALGQPARQRHLAALEMRLVAAGTVMSRACLDALVAFARRLARARTRTSA